MRTGAPAPGAQHAICCVEFDCRRCRQAAFGDRRLGSGAEVQRRNRRRALDSDIIVPINRHAAGVAQQSIVRQLLRPTGTGAVGLGHAGRGSEQCPAEQCRAKFRILIDSLWPIMLNKLLRLANAAGENQLVDA